MENGSEVGHMRGLNQEGSLNDGHSRKRRAMEGKIEIDLSLMVEDCGREPAEIKNKKIRSSMNDLGKVEEEGEAMEGITSNEKSSSLMVPALVSDSEIDEQSKMQNQLNTNVWSDRSVTVRDSTSSKNPIIRNEIDSLHTEVDRMKEENKNLKVALSQMMNDYQNLQTYLLRVQEAENNAPAKETAKEPEKLDEDSDLVFLSLGTNPSSSKPTKEETAGGERRKEALKQTKGSQEHPKCLSLGLDFKGEETSDETNETTVSPRSSPSKSEGGLMKSDSMDVSLLGRQNQPQHGSFRSNKEAGENLEAAVPARKARVSVRARCEGSTMNDGCQWRKYGQKIAKGNPCPRAYYRCTVAPGCPVRKQVQRCADDMAILITTYEGSHNHSLPIAATAMGSTTAAAACMLASGSTSSMEAMNTNNPYISRLDQYFASNPTISTTSSFPTITLDLTKTPTSQLNPLNSLGSSSTSFVPSFPLPFQYPSAGPNLHSTNPHSNTTILHSEHSQQRAPSSNPWNNTHLYYNQHYSRPNSAIPIANYDLASQRFQTSPDSSLNNQAARTTQEALSRYNSQTMMQNSMANTSSKSISGAPNSLADKVTVATAAITSDPNFTNALVNAIASIISTQGAQSQGRNGNAANNLVLNPDQRKWGQPTTDPVSLNTTHPSESNMLFSPAS
ncbi:hypothetical protein SUGI_0310490 [Cryptomeria japonica]|uniref:WRKY transcription factor 72B n=1 Tax=Cryptomeria japonica TaxID=3369 RepID=UPI002408B45E|nr:WRKY transcription factor 72B [Cryptomeria japonica]GLJ17780.1 hypothetical protein SUGI_0310490 [Cryptomeria japonica]